MNQFGGKWTEAKIEILVEYAKAYLTIMNFYANKYKWKLLYFDGFAGSGFITKGKEAIERSAELYKKRLSELFEYVSNPYTLKNTTNSIMFHFYMVSNNKSAVKIANEIIEKYNKQK